MTEYVASWARVLDSSANDNAKNVVYDGIGNVYTVIHQQSDINTVSSMAITGSATLPDSSGNRIVVIKANTAGTIQWIKRIDARTVITASGAAANDLDIPLCIAADANRVVIGGMLGYDPTTTTTLTVDSLSYTFSGPQGFVISLAASTGTAEWGYKTDGHVQIYNNIFNIIIHNNIIYASGVYGSSPSMTIQPGITVPSTDIGITYTGLLFIAFSSNGTALWARSINGMAGSDGYITDLTISNGILHACGGYKSIATNTVYPQLTSTLTSYHAGLLLGLDITNGTVSYIRRIIENPGVTIATGIIPSTNGIIVIGKYAVDPANPIDLGNGIGLYSGLGGTDSYIIKYNNSGIAQWAFSFNGATEEFANVIADDRNGGIYVAGLYYSSIPVFRNLTTVFATLPRASFLTTAAYLAHFTSNGTFDWVKIVDTAGPWPAGFDHSISLKTNSAGDIFWFGTYGATGSQVLLDNGKSLPATTTPAPFVVQYDIQGICIKAKGIPNINFINSTYADNSNPFIRQIDIDSNNNIYMSIMYNSNSTVTVDSAFFPATTNFASALVKLTNTVINVPCVCAGTMIRTARGERAVETLAAGDLVLTADGREVAIKGIYTTEIASCSGRNAPYVIQAGAFGYSLPNADLTISPGHALMVRPGQWMIPCHTADPMLRSKMSRYANGQEVTYYHVELPNYLQDTFIANGVVSESYGINWAKTYKGPSVYTQAANGLFTRISSPQTRKQLAPRMTANPKKN